LHNERGLKEREKYAASPQLFCINRHLEESLLNVSEEKGRVEALKLVFSI